MRKRMLWHVALILYIFFLFSNSLTPADQSSAASGRVLYLLHQFLGYFGVEALWLTEHVVRKCAHFSEYTVMGILLLQSMKNLDCGIVIKRQLHTLAVFFVPFVDETLQLFTEGRSGQLSDVWLDISGVLAGTLAAFFAGLAAQRRKGKSRDEKGQAERK